MRIASVATLPKSTIRIREHIALLTLTAIFVTACNAVAVTPSPTPHGDPVAPTLRWNREGGVAGFCDVVYVFADGDVVAYSCHTDPMIEVGKGSLMPSQLSQLKVWIAAFETFELQQTDPATADAMDIRLVFTGSGTGEATEADRASMLALAADLWPTVSEEAPTPTPEVFIPVPEDARAQSAARDALGQQLGVDISVITVRKIVQEDWPDSCLGLTVRGQACQWGSTPGYRIVLEVNGAVYEVRTDASAQTVMVAGRVDSTLGGLPDICQGTGLLTYYAPENGFCFAYPGNFTLGETSPVRASIFGPAIDQNLDALRASLQFEIRPLNAGEDLKSVVDTYLAEFAGLPTPEIQRTATKLGGEPAEQLEVVPGREGSRDVFIVRDGTLFHFLFMPSVRDFPQAASDVEDLFMTVTLSFTFLSPTAPTGGN